MATNFRHIVGITCILLITVIGLLVYLDSKKLTNQTLTEVADTEHFAYLEQAENGKQDAIVQIDADLKNRKELFKDDNIYQFSLNKNFLLVPLSKLNNNLESTQYLKILNLRDRQIRTVTLNNINIADIQVSPREDKAVIVYEERTEDVETKKIRFTTGLMLYDIPSDSFTKFDTQNTIIKDSKVTFAPDGLTVLYNGAQSTFYAFDLIDINVTVVGKYAQTGGFDGSGSKLVFIETKTQTGFNKPTARSVIIKELDKEDVPIGPFNKSIMDPIFNSRSESIIFALESELLPNPKYFDYGNRAPRYAMYKIVEGTPDGAVKDLVNNNGYSFELPVLSTSGRYIVMEKYKKSQFEGSIASRIFYYGSKPDTAELVVYDQETENIIENGIQGTNSVWLR